MIESREEKAERKSREKGKDPKLPTQISKGPALALAGPLDTGQEIEPE